MAPKKFTVVKLSGTAEPEKNSYVIVPTSWVKIMDDQFVAVPYPSRDQLPVAFERIVNSQPALAEWEDQLGVVEREAETYKAGLLYVKRKDSEPLDEEVLLLWRRSASSWLKDLGVYNLLLYFTEWCRAFGLCEANRSL